MMKGLCGNRPVAALGQKNPLDNPNPSRILFLLNFLAALSDKCHVAEMWTTNAESAKKFRKKIHKYCISPHRESSKARNITKRMQLSAIHAV